jgi:hypothetical protein
MSDAAASRCPRCGAELGGPSRKHGEGGLPGGVCPYAGRPLADLRAAHDAIYFGPWRRMDASPLDILRAYRQLGRHIESIGEALSGRELPAAARDLAQAADAHRAADPAAESENALRFMDNALSYAHRAIDDILREDGASPHRPMDFSEWYDSVEVPFREEW